MFYGWYIALAGSLLMTLGTGLPWYGLTAFINPIATTFGWGYAQVSLAMAIRGAESGGLEPVAGIMADRWPARRLVLVGAVITALGFVALSQVTNLVMYYASFVIIGLGSALLGLVPIVAMSRWFKADVGKASGVVFMGIGVSGLAVPALVGLIDTFSWQTTLIILAAGLLILGAPLSLVFRNRPEDHGLLPDGRPPVALTASDSPLERHDFGAGLGVREALRTRAFWHFTTGYMLQVAATAALTLHVMPYLTSVGVERSTGALVAMALPVGSIPVRFMFGWLADIFPKKYALALSMFFTSVSLFLFSLLNARSPLGLIILFIVVCSLAIGGVLPLRAAVVREYFGTKHFGTIYGMAAIFGTIGMVSGPPVAGWVFDIRGAYDPIWLILGVGTMIGMVLALSMPPPAAVPSAQRTGQ